MTYATQSCACVKETHLFFTAPATEKTRGHLCPCAQDERGRKDTLQASLPAFRAQLLSTGRNHRNKCPQNTPMCSFDHTRLENASGVVQVATKSFTSNAGFKAFSPDLHSRTMWWAPRFPESCPESSASSITARLAPHSTPQHTVCVV